jgi:HEAT repeat protein
MNLQTALTAVSSASASVRKAAVEALANEAGHPAALSALRLALEDSDFGVRRLAVEALVSWIKSPADATKELVSALELAGLNERPIVRANAVTGLAKCGGAGLSEKLLGFWYDADHRVHRAAANALVEHARPTDVPFFINALADSLPIRVGNAARVLGRIGDPSGVPALLRALDNDDSAVRVNAIEAVAVIGDPFAAPKLIAALRRGLEESDAAVSRAATRAL